MNFIDGSARGLPPPANVFFQMKSRDTFAPMKRNARILGRSSPRRAQGAFKELLGKAAKPTRTFPFCADVFHDPALAAPETPSTFALPTAIGAVSSGSAPFSLSPQAQAMERSIFDCIIRVCLSTTETHSTSPASSSHDEVGHSDDLVPLDGYRLSASASAGETLSPT
jgi:hypothetical protein